MGHIYKNVNKVITFVNNRLTGQISHTFPLRFFWNQFVQRWCMVKNRSPGHMCFFVLYHGFLSTTYVFPNLFFIKTMRGWLNSVHNQVATVHPLASGLKIVTFATVLGLQWLCKKSGLVTSREELSLRQRTFMRLAITWPTDRTLCTNFKMGASNFSPTLGQLSDRMSENFGNFNGMAGDGWRNGRYHTPAHPHTPTPTHTIFSKRPWNFLKNLP